MNELIKELAEQAGGKFFPGWWEGMSTFVKFYKEEDLQKFTALIVRECLDQIENEAAQYDEPVWAFQMKLVNDIKEHFGVK